MAAEGRSASGPTPSSPWATDYRTWALGLLLAAVTFAAYAQTFLRLGRYGGHEFVFDDTTYILKNPHLRDGLTWPALNWALTTHYANNWHPLTWVSLQLDYRLFGPGRPDKAPEAAGFLFTNVLLHAANSVLLFLLFRRMTGQLWPAFLTAALFAWHPLHVESVAWVSERKDVLSTLFCILATWAYVRFAERPGFGRYLLTALVFGLGLMSKSMLVTLPFVFLLLDYWPLGRCQEGWRAAVRLLLEKVPLLAMAAATSAVTVVAQGGAVNPLKHLSLHARVSNALYSYVAYLGQTVWPFRLAAFYPHPLDSLPVWKWVGAVVLLAVVSLSAILLRRRCPYLPVGWFWYLGTLVPVIGLVQVGSQGMADRYTYLPHIGLFVALSWGLADLVRRGTAPGVLLECAAAGTLAALVVLTWAQCGTWKNSEILWHHAQQVTKDNYMAHINLGVHYDEKNRLDEAIDEDRKALAIKPDSVHAHYNLGLALGKKGRLGEAAPHFARALEISPEFYNGHYYLGMIHLQQGRLDEAEAEFREALRVAAEQKQSYPAAHQGLGLVYLQRGKPEQAAGYFDKAQETDDSLKWQAAADLGVAYTMAGDLDAARQVYRYLTANHRPPSHLPAVQGVEVDPLWLQRANEFARALATDPRPERRDGPRAVRLAELLCRSVPGIPEFLDTLAAAYAEVGRFADAVAPLESALPLAESQRKPEPFLDRLREHLRSVRDRKPIRDVTKR